MYSFFSVILLLCLSLLFLKALHSFLWLPHQIERHFWRQGITGPPRRFLAGGNAGDIRRLFMTAQSSTIPQISHDIAGRVAPHYAQWSTQYGRSFLYWFGSQPRLAIGDPAAVRAAMTDTSGAIDKGRPIPALRELFGEGLVGLTGEQWARHRRIVGHAFSTERVKVSMILKETMRLYSPAALFNRVAMKNVKIGGIDIPASTLLYAPVISIHHDPEHWGPDADEFNPLRFSSSDKGEKHTAFFPFGVGPRICVGQNLALVELKVALSMILQRFEFEVSPGYVHSPRLLMTIEPQYGVQILLRKV